MFQRFKNLKAKPLLTHLIITLAYPLAKAITSESKKLLVFCDVLTIVACVLLLAGVVYSLALHGDFDIAGFALKRGIHANDPVPQTYDAYRKDRKEKREDAFNYPLFLGLVYVAVSAFIAFALL